MRIDHLTFGQLYQLQNPRTLMRVTQAYHSALRRVWDADVAPHGMDFFPEPFSVHAAEEAYPLTARPWIRVLRFLGSSQLRNAVREAADAQAVPRLPGGCIEVLRVPIMGRGRAAAETLAFLARIHCGIFCVPSEITERFQNTHHHCFVVRAETTELGSKALMFKSGLMWEDIRYVHLVSGVHVHHSFGWVPQGTPNTARINPLNWPVNTPDCSTVGASFVNL